MSSGFVGFGTTVCVLGTSKKVAKKAAAAAALAKLTAILKNPLTKEPSDSVSDGQKKADYIGR